MAEVVVGVVLTALLGGLGTPYLKGLLDRRSERFRASATQVDTLAASLWAYWKLALRVAYYGMQGERGSKDLDLALQSWDSDDAWQIGREIQIQFSRSKRLFPPSVHAKLDHTQEHIVSDIDRKIDRLRYAETRDWKEFHESLMTETRTAIDSLLTDAMRALKIGGTRKG